MIKILFLSLVFIQLVKSFQYNLVKSDIVSTAAHTWKDSTNTALAAAATMCTYLKQPYIGVSSTTAQTLSNVYVVNNNDHEVYVKIIFSGTWNNEAFSIYSDTTLLKIQSLTSSTWTQSFCTLTNTKQLLFKVTVPKASLITSGSTKQLKLKFTYPASASTKSIYMGPILIYEVLPDAVTASTYIENEPFNYFTSISQNPTASLASFSFSSLDTILNSKIDILAIGGTNVNFMVGGFSIFNTGTLTFTQALNPHYRINFNFQVYQFDSSTTLTSSNFIITVIDTSSSTIIPTEKIKQIQTGNLFGGTEMDSIYYVDFELDHTQSTLQIKFQLTITSFIGITNFKLISKNCPQFCQSCRSKGTCDICSSVTNRNVVTCQCNSQFYEDLVDHQCKACDYRCDTCEYDGIHIVGNCILCKYGFDINQQCKTCVISNQYEIPAQIKCENCASCCLTCTGPSDKECLTFRSNYLIMPDNQCTTACPSNYFTYVQTPQRSLCILCDLSCKTCADIQTRCTSCFPGYILLFNMCLVECPISTYRLNKDCTPCIDSLCQYCTESQCLLCLPNNYMSKVVKMCVSQCEAGYYADIDARACKKCHQTCKECVGPAFTQCSQCQSSQYMLTLDSVKIIGICYQVCKEGYYPQGQLCAPCFSGCQFCTSYQVCQTCVAGYYLYNDFCIEECPSQMYPNTLVQKCLSCNKACIECFGGENYQCNTCSGNLSQYKGKCYIACPMTTVSKLGICQPCTTGCDVCTGTNINDCTTCSANFYFLNGQCFETCPASYQANIQTQVCEFCIMNCEMCISNNCKLCATGYYFQDAMCNLSCSSNSYKSEVDRKCKDCDVTCATCSGPNIDNCLTCPNSYYFFSNKCLPDCPIGYYGDAQKICKKCDLTCYDCNGPSNKNCKSCIVSTYLYQYQCLSICPNGTYGNDDSLQCLPCHSSCLTCQGGTLNDCLTCPVYVERMKCVIACSVNFILDTNGKECIPEYPITLTCSPQCATCSLQASNCNTCYVSRVQKKPQCPCNKGFYDVGQPDCLPCLNKCETCAGTADSCLMCKGNRYGATCLCPDYFYEDGVSEYCPKCDYKCGLCTNNICSTCADRRTNAPTCGCPDGYFDNQQPACQPCDLVCLTCKDFAENCVTCSGIRINPPYCTCPPKYFDFSSQCIPCAFECNYCDSNGCSTCSGNMSGPFSGKCICKDGYSRKSIDSPYCTNCDLGVPYAILLSGLTKISIDFGGPLVLVTVGQSGCDQFFQASTLSTLGTNPICTISENAIIVTLGKSSTIQIGHSFSFGIGFKLKICADKFPNFMPALLIVDPKTQNEQNAPYITFGSQQPKTVCEDVKITYTLGNTGSRNLQIFSWGLTLPPNYVNAKLSTILNAITPTKTYEPYILIPKLVLSQYTSFQFTVQLENFLNLQGSNSIYVQTQGPATIDIVLPETMNTFHRYEKSILNYSLSYYNCTLNGEMQDVLNTKIAFNSKIIAEFNQDVYLQMNCLLELSYIVDEFVLDVGSNNITLTLSLQGQSVTRIDFLNQEISEGSLLVHVAGGNRQVGDVAIVVMTVTITDQDIGPAETDLFAYDVSWACFDVLKGVDCIDSFGKLLTYPNGRNITVYASALQQYNSYIFIATTHKGNKKASGKSMIQVVEIDLPQLSPANFTSESETVATTFNYYDEIKLSFAYETKNPDNLFCSATIIYYQNVQTSFQFYGLTFKFKLLDYFSDLNRVKGNQITLRVSIYNPSFVMPSLRSIILTFNLPPRNCEVIFNNEHDKILELETKVNITVTLCEDDDMPIQYQVLFYKNDEIYKNDLLLGRFQNNIKLLEYQQNNTLLFTVPYLGSEDSSNYTSLLIILIKDNQNGIFNITYPINVYQNNKLDQAKLSKMIDHNENLDQTIQIQDLVVSKLIQQTNCSEFKYSILRKNDLLSTTKLSIGQQNSLFYQMTQLINDEEVAKQFDVNLSFLSNYKILSTQNYEALLQLQSQPKTTLEQQIYIDNYYKTFDLFSSLIKNSQYFSNTNDQILENLDIMKSQLINFTVQNSDGFNMSNSNQQQIIKKASNKILNQITGNILKEETFFRLLKETVDTNNYQYFFNIYKVNPFLNEEKFPRNDYFGAEVVYLRVIDEATQQVPIMLQPFTYTFTILETYGNANTLCIQRIFTNWTSNEIETNLVNSFTIQCKTYYFYPFTLIINSTDNKFNSTSNETSTSDSQQANQDDNNNDQTNNNQLNDKTTQNNTSTEPTDSTQNTTSNTLENFSSEGKSNLLISQQFYIYLIVLGGLTLILACLAHFKDVRYAKVFDEKKSSLEIIMTHQKDDSPEMKRIEELSEKDKHSQIEQKFYKNEIYQQKGKKAKIIFFNLHSLISIFYRDQGGRKIAFLFYLLRFLLIQAAILLSYIYEHATFSYYDINVSKLVVLVFILAPLAFSIYSFILNYPTKEKAGKIFQIFSIILGLTALGLSIYRISQFIDQFSDEQLEIITYILVASIIYDNLIYNLIKLLVIFISILLSRKIETFILKFIPTSDREVFLNKAEIVVKE